MLKDKAHIAEALMTAFETADKMDKGFAKAVLINPSPENQQKMLNTTMKCTKHLAEMVKMLAIINLVYISGDNYNSDIAKVLVRMGKGKEALQEIFKQKMQK